MEQDLISIIVPVYKVEPYLNRCIQSIVNQTYKNLEIILVDDESPDNCPVMCDTWAQRDTRIKVIHKKNGGLADARNMGLEVAKGTYFTFVDSDDYVDERFVELLCVQMQENDAQISCVGLQNFNDRNLVVLDMEPHKTEVYNKKDAIAALFDESKFGNYMWNKLFQRELFDTIKFPTGKSMEDLAIVYLLFAQCEHISYCPAKVYFYNQREGSILHKVNIKLQTDWYSTAKERYFYIREKYPDMEENYRYFNMVVLCCYPYLQGKEAIYARQEFKRNWHYGVNASLGKAKFKAYLFRLSGWLYCKVWAIWQTKKT